MSLLSRISAPMLTDDLAAMVTAILSNRDPSAPQELLEPVGYLPAEGHAGALGLHRPPCGPRAIGAGNDVGPVPLARRCRPAARCRRTSRA